jgi:hypothetical protein
MGGFLMLCLSLAFSGIELEILPLLTAWSCNFVDHLLQPPKCPSQTSIILVGSR